VISLVSEIGPELIAHDDGVMLLRDVPGPDRHGAPEPWMVHRWVAHQHAWTGHLGNVPDWRSESFIPAVERLDCPDELLAELPRRFDQLAGCRLPDTIVHGDFHAGNWRGDTLLDWGDSGFGHPLLDQPAFGDDIAPWIETWKRLRPESDPARAAHLIAPIAALRQAHIYKVFMDNIEPSEQCYHRHDTAEWLSRAVALRDRYTL
jgi:Ser/Thr protein kinase RdoA (MazF antagonist)